MVIRDCISRRGAGLLPIGSETAGDIRHVYVSNILGIGTSNGLNIKSAISRGGTVEDIDMENIGRFFYRKLYIKKCIHRGRDYRTNSL